MPVHYFCEISATKTVRPIINTTMKKCRSQSRCGQIACAVCARRYAGHMAKRIASDATGKLYAVQIDLTPSSLADFWRWRAEVRNLINYRRRESRWWRSVGMQVWLCYDGKLRGITNLGSLMETEFLGPFTRRWLTTLRSIDPSDLRREIASIVHPNMIAPVQVKARYQPVRMAVRPQRIEVKAKSLCTPEPFRTWVEPMPILL